MWDLQATGSFKLVCFIWFKGSKVLIPILYSASVILLVITAWLLYLYKHMICMINSFDASAWIYIHSVMKLVQITHLTISLDLCCHNCSNTDGSPQVLYAPCIVPNGNTLAYRIIWCSSSHSWYPGTVADESKPPIYTRNYLLLTATVQHLSTLTGFLDQDVTGFNVSMY